MTYGGAIMEIKHKIDVSDAINAIADKFRSNTNAQNEIEKDDIDFNEFRFRIKTIGGTDINIPGSAIGFIIGAICIKSIFSAINKLSDNKH